MLFSYEDKVDIEAQCVLIGQLPSEVWECNGYAVEEYQENVPSICTFGRLIRIVPSLTCHFISEEVAERQR